MEILTIITARSGSKRIPRKNILPLGGKPLLAWTIQCAQETKLSQRIIVTTDSEEISTIAREWGAEVPFIRSSELASDTASSEDVVMNVIDWMKQNDELKAECLVLLQPTSPFRTAHDIEAAVSLFQEKKADAVLSVCEDPFPLKWLVQLGIEGEITPIGGAENSTMTCRLNGAIYVISIPRFILEKSFALSKSFAYVMPAERSLDIDTPWDFHLAELIVENRYANAKT